MIASKLRLGDEVRVIAPSRNLTEVRQDVHHHAVDFWRKEGFNLTFSRNSREAGKFHSSCIASRVEDIHEAFSDPNVKMVITCLGGFNCNQLLRHLDYDLIAKNPKSFADFLISLPCIMLSMPKQGLSLTMVHTMAHSPSIEKLNTPAKRFSIV